MQYKDENFRKCSITMLNPKGQRIPATSYSYETRARLYDIIVKNDNHESFILRVNSKKAEVHSAHHEIDKYFNLGLKL